MPRPKRPRCVGFLPEVVYFKPRGIPLSLLKEVDLTVDEFETLRLADLENLEQTEAAKKMKVSQSTFQRILTNARKKLAEAVVLGKAIRVEGGVYQMAKMTTRKLKCEECGHVWEIPFGTGEKGIQLSCPTCQSRLVHRIDQAGHGFGRQPWGYKKK